MHVVAFANRHRLKLAAVALALLGLFLVVEVGVRVLPPDAVEYQGTFYMVNGPAITQSGTITDPARIARWRAAMANHPTDDVWLDVLLNPGTCAGGSTYRATYRFLWHGLPLETVSSLPTCRLLFEISRGGIPDLHTYIIDPLFEFPAQH